jgi:hypothetical protein
MVTEMELQMDPEEETYIGNEHYNLPCYQHPSSNSEDSGGKEEGEPESGTWQIRSNRNVYAGLTMTYTSSWSHNPIHCM